jgi:hypothetical protein
VIDIATGQVEGSEPPTTKDPAAVERGSSRGSKGRKGSGCRDEARWRDVAPLGLQADGDVQEGEVRKISGCDMRAQAAFIRPRLERRAPPLACRRHRCSKYIEPEPGDE